MPCDWQRPESRRYLRSLAISMLIYMVLLFISIRWMKQAPPAPWKYLIAVMPVVPALWVPVAVVRFLRDLDELQRKIHMDALAFGFTLSAVLTLSYGFLQNAGLPDLSWTFVWPVMAFSWILGLFLSRRRYQ
jgi:hypothetical protein